MELLAEVGRCARGGAAVRIAAVCDVFEPRRERARAITQAAAHHHWREVVARTDVDAVIVATPDHWHAAMAVAAMEAGKDVYCERPMALRIEEARAFRDSAQHTGRVVQIGAQRTSEAQWRLARELVRAGMVGKVLWGQDNGGRGSTTAEWGRTLESGVDRATVDWEAFLGNAPKRPFCPERFLRWRHYRDYSAGLAASLCFDHLAPVLSAIGPDSPERVSAAGGIWIHDGRELPDTLIVTAEYRNGHTIVIASSTAGAGGMPAVIRGSKAAMHIRGGRVILMPEDALGAYLHERHDGAGARTYRGRHRPGHLANWLDCIRTRQPCVCDPELGYRTMAAIRMSVDAYRKGKTLYFDTDTEAVIASPPRVPPAGRHETA